ncbi:MAG: hypothetical protein OHK0017_03030 [Patescibacteria group bacterium]
MAVATAVRVIVEPVENQVENQYNPDFDLKLAGAESNKLAALCTTNER